MRHDAADPQEGTPMMQRREVPEDPPSRNER